MTTWVKNPGQLVSNAAQKTIKCFSLQCEAPERSGDVSASLFGGGRPDYAEQLKDYRKDFVDPRHDRIPKNERYPNASVDTAKIAAVEPEIAPASGLSNTINAVMPFDVVDVKDFVYNTIIRFVQVLMIIGAIAVLFWNRFGSRLPTEYTLLSLVSLAIVIATVVVPGLSVRYGIFRAFEQALIVCGPLLIIGSFTVFAWTSQKWQRIMTTVIALGFLASTLGMLQFVFGGGNYSMHLANKGVYYDTYYTHNAERNASMWLKGYYNNHGGGLVQMDAYTYGKWRNAAGIPANTELYPTLIRKNSYVLLGHTNVTKQTATVFHNGTLITYTYPVSFLDEQKDLLYNNGSARVYR